MMIDMATLNSIPDLLGRRPCVLDVACGTGLLLKKLLGRIPDLDVYGADASIDMLTQACTILKDIPNVHLERSVVDTSETLGLPFAPHSFDLIICTNALHYLPDPIIL